MDTTKQKLLKLMAVNEANGSSPNEIIAAHRHIVTKILPAYLAGKTGNNYYEKELTKMHRDTIASQELLIRSLDYDIQRLTKQRDACMKWLEIYVGISIALGLFVVILACLFFGKH